MSDNESNLSDCESTSNGLSESMGTIHNLVEQIAHDTKHLYAKALKLHTDVEHPDLDLWTGIFKLHERANKWAKHHMVARKCSLWQIHRTLLESAKRDNRVFRGQQVRLLKDEAEILDLPENHPVSVWMVLGRLPRFFV
jgi:hypothetical protein